MESVKVATAHKLSLLVRSEKALIIDSRTFCEYNTSHILNSVNVWSSKIRKKRLQQDSISVHDYLAQACHVSEVNAGVDIIVYDHSASSLSAVPNDSFLHVLLTKLGTAFPAVFLLAGGFLEFQARYPELCEDSSQKATPLTTQSQPCMPVANLGPTRILPFLYLGSQTDANNRQLLQGYNILYELNVSVSCPKPDFLQDSHFMRIPVNDNFSEKLLPYFNDAFNFIDKVREGGGCVLVHCLAGVSRSATVAIAYVMKHLSLPFEEAYMYVKSRRPTISPNINFVGQLAELDRQLRRDPLTAPRDPLSAPVLLRPSPPTPATTSTSPAPPPSPTAPQTRPPSGSLAKSLSLNLRSSLEETHAFLSPRSPADLSPSTALARLSFPPPSTPPRSPRSPVFTLRRGCASPSSPAAASPCPFFRNRLASGGAASMPKVERGAPAPAPREGENRPPETAAPGRPEGSSCRGRQVSVCVIEVCGGAQPVRYVRREPMVVRETPVEATPLRPIAARCHLQVDLTAPTPPTPTPPTSITTPTTPTPTPTATPTPTPIRPRGGVWTPEAPKEASVAGPSPPRPGSPTSPGVQQSDSGILVGTSCPRCPPSPAPRLPRCHSSSETHLSTRRLLEQQPTHDFSARKCCSYDEVGRAWPLCAPPQPATVPPRPWELCRSDSVSTSGFGSEISDSDFLTEDAAPPQDDPLGPFQAVFADVFPGEHTQPVPHSTPPRHPPTGHAPPRATRPASLPGVTGTYFSHLQNEGSLDMGVELDKEDDEEEEEDDEEEEEEEADGGVELRGGGRRGVEKKDSGYYSFLTEHPPPSPRTMGDGVRHTTNTLWRREKTEDNKNNNKNTVPSLPAPPTSTSSSSSSSSSSSPASSSTSFSSSSSSLSVEKGRKEKRKNRGASVEEKEEKRRSCEMEGGEEGRWSPPSVIVSSGCVLNATQQQQKQEEEERETQVEVGLAELKRRTAAASSLRITSRSEDTTPQVPPRTRLHRGGRTHLGDGGGRARSEPPLPIEEGLYRARSCPGLPRPAGHPGVPQQLVSLRAPRADGSRAPPLNRYSCGALEGVQPPPAHTHSVTFESCPDFGSLRQCVRGDSTHSSSSSSLSSTHSFTRLLQVS